MNKTTKNQAQKALIEFSLKILLDKKQLKPIQFQVLLFSFVQENTIDEISEKLSLSVQRVSAISGDAIRVILSEKDKIFLDYTNLKKRLTLLEKEQKNKLIPKVNSPSFCSNKYASMIPVTELELSGRIQNSLRRGNIKNLKDLVACSEKKLRYLPGIGESSLDEIKQMLNKRGIVLESGFGNSNKKSIHKNDNSYGEDWSELCPGDPT